MSMGQKRTMTKADAPDLAGHARAALVRLVTGRGKDAVARSGGIAVRTLDRYLRGETCPGLTTGLRLMRDHDDFAADLLLGAGLSASAITGACPAGETLREVVEGAAALAAAWADLRIDHTEWPRVRAELLGARICIDRFLVSEGRVGGDRA